MFAAFIIFPKLETRFNTHYQNAYANAFRNEYLELLRLSLNSIASTSREEGLVTAQLHCAVSPVEQRSCGSVGDIKTFQNDFAFITPTETRFWLKRVSDRIFLAFQKGISNPLIKTALSLSSANITLKSCLETRSVMINAPFDTQVLLMTKCTCLSSVDVTMFIAKKMKAGLHFLIS